MGLASLAQLIPAVSGEAAAPAGDPESAERKPSGSTVELIAKLLGAGGVVTIISKMYDGRIEITLLLAGIFFLAIAALGWPMRDGQSRIGSGLIGALVLTIALALYTSALDPRPSGPATPEEVRDAQAFARLVGIQASIDATSLRDLLWSHGCRIP